MNLPDLLSGRLIDKFDLDNLYYKLIGVFLFITTMAILKLLDMLWDRELTWQDIKKIWRRK